MNILNKTCLYNPHLQIFSLILIFLTVVSKGITTGDAWFTDASRHAMNGVYFLDLFSKGSFDNIYQSAIEYYARYPAISLGYHPPFFPFVESIVFAIGGVSFLTARFAVLIFGVVGLIFWYKLIRLMYDERIAFFSTLFIFTTPFVVYWSREVMLELPALTMIILTVYAFYMFIELHRRKYVYMLSICLGLSLLTKQTTFFLMPLFFIYLLKTKRLSVLFKKDVILPALILLCLCTIAVALTVIFGQGALNLANMPIGLIAEHPKLSITNMIYYLGRFNNIFSLQIILLSIFSFIFLLPKFRYNYLDLFFLWFLIDYILISYISAKDLRYTFFLIPPICLIATLTLFKLDSVVKKPRIVLLLAFLLGSMQSVQAYNLPAPYISGYEAAAKFLAQRVDNGAIFLSGYHDANFTFNFRKHCQNSNNLIIRMQMLVYQNGEDSKNIDFLKVFNDYGIRSVVVEDINIDNDTQFARLKKVLNTSKFTKLKKFPIESNVNSFKNKSILIYEYNQASQSMKDSIRITIDRAGKDFYVPTQRPPNRITH